MIPAPEHDREELHRRFLEREAEKKRAATAENERIKLTATMVSQIGVIVVTIGFVTPLLTTGLRWLQEQRVISAICIILWIGLHLVARRLLRGLK
ncbi:hypothetical protein GCM10011491_26270 [Brucella endophytica]|uniref:Uncharacterized protein n=1 Tax=Brucella endophytica TaxID=1963359 RepID=A0A916SET5_9HYPH|nr:hypothetical protein [Brucella endophytica]GGA96682.1 hypothetical protein GCM10011491_26270 [Brucella endophytica]